MKKYDLYIYDEYIYDNKNRTKIFKLLKYLNRIDKLKILHRLEIFTYIPIYASEYFICDINNSFDEDFLKLDIFSQNRITKLLITYVELLSENIPEYSTPSLCKKIKDYIFMMALRYTTSLTYYLCNGYMIEYDSEEYDTQ